MHKWLSEIIFLIFNCPLLLSSSSGAFIPGLPVQPVVLRYPNKLVNTLHPVIPFLYHFLFIFYISAPYKPVTLDIVPD